MSSVGGILGVLLLCLVGYLFVCMQRFTTNSWPEDGSRGSIHDWVGLIAWIIACVAFVLTLVFLAWQAGAHVFKF